MRRLNRKETLKVVKELDAFPKIPEDYVKTTSTGGTGNIDHKALKGSSNFVLDPLKKSLI